MTLKFCTDLLARLLAAHESKHLSKIFTLSFIFLYSSIFSACTTVNNDDFTFVLRKPPLTKRFFQTIYFSTVNPDEYVSQLGVYKLTPPSRHIFIIVTRNKQQKRPQTSPNASDKYFCF